MRVYNSSKGVVYESESRLKAKLVYIMYKLFSNKIYNTVLWEK